jgi:uncharacterized protein (DUF1800 family)
MSIRLKSRHGFVVAFTLLLITGCGGSTGGGGGGLLGASIFDDGKEFGGSAQSAAKYRDTLTSDEAYHLLRTAAFGATPEQVSAAVGRGLEATVDDLLSVKALPSTMVALEESYEEHVSKRWMVRLIESPNPLHEQMTMFWHDRFATSARVLSGRDRGLAQKHWEMLERNAMGNYRTFLQELTIDPLMLLWLNGGDSPKSNPNENYAREFWELFTLGRDVLYTEADIKESARAFTGITLLRESGLDARPIFDIINHDETLKNVFPSRAAPANYDYLAMIDLTLAQDEAAEYVARNLFEYFVHREPSQAVIRDLARSFAQSDFELAPLVKRILMSQAMFSSAAIGSQIRTPVAHVVGVARTLDMHIYSEDSQGSQMNRLIDDLKVGGHELLNPPGVEGWGEGTYWLEDQWIISRVRALGRSMEYGTDRTALLPYHLLPDADTWDQREARRQIVDAMASVFHLELTEEEIEIYIEVLDQNGWRALHLEEPDRRTRHVGEMIRLMAMNERVMGR